MTRTDRSYPLHHASTRRRWCLPVLLLASLLGACGYKPPREQVEKSTRSVASWAVTAEMIGRRWLAGDVPSPYAHITLQSAQTRVASARTSLEKNANAEPLALAAIDRYRRLASLLGEMADATERGDRSAITRLLAQLPEAERSVQALGDEVRAAG